MAVGHGGAVDAAGTRVTDVSGGGEVVEASERTELIRDGGGLPIGWVRVVVAAMELRVGPTDHGRAGQVGLVVALGLGRSWPWKEKDG